MEYHEPYQKNESESLQNVILKHIGYNIKSSKNTFHQKIIENRTC